MRIRPTILWFAEQMEKRLRVNDHKGGWEDEHYNYLLIRLEEETAELKDSLLRLFSAKTKRHITREAADVANFAMMIADNYGRDEEITEVRDEKDWQG